MTDARSVLCGQFIGIHRKDETGVRVSKRLQVGWAAAIVLLASTIAASALGQTVAFDHGASATATGSGSTGTPSLSFNVAAGQNRVVFVTATFERDHCTTDTNETQSTCTDETTANSNFASPIFVANNGANVQIQLTATGPGGAITASNPLAPPAGDLRDRRGFVLGASRVSSHPSLDRQRPWTPTSPANSRWGHRANLGRSCGGPSMAAHGAAPASRRPDRIATMFVIDEVASKHSAAPRNSAVRLC